MIGERRTRLKWRSSLPITAADLDQFHEFARQKLGNGGADSLEELVELWKSQTLNSDELKESLHALEQGIADVAAGRVRPVEDVFQDLAARYDVDFSK